jgi:ubiquinone/menaquinone biosynthesis C-methylase UbiE
LDSRVENSRHIKVTIHQGFYNWSKSWVNGKIVLDAGCGGGYGTAILAETAAKVVGIDIDPKIIKIASHLYPSENVEFQIMDCREMAFQSASFDVIVCNALFEYLTDITAFMERAFRILKPDGLFICGTKNLQLSLKSSEGLPLYRNHLQEFNPAELRLNLEKYYTGIRIYGERMKARSEAYIMNRQALKIEGLLVALRIKHFFPRSWRNLVRKLITGVSVDDITINDFEIVENFLDDAFFLIGCGTKK